MLLIIMHFLYRGSAKSDSNDASKEEEKGRMEEDPPAPLPEAVSETPVM